MATLDDDIARMLEDSRQRGELQSAPSWGKPLQPEAGYDETPAELRMPFKILKDAGVLPPEVELMRQLQSLRDELKAAASDAPREKALALRVAEKQQAVAMCLERLRGTGSL